MKTLFIEARKKVQDFEKTNIDYDALPRKIIIAYSIQYQEIAENIKNSLKSKGFSIKGFFQVLGCSKLDTKIGIKIASKNNCAILLIGSGRFHALNLASQTDSPIYIYGDGRIETLSMPEIEKIREKKRLTQSLFLNSEKIGILVSTKQGQQDLKTAEKLKKEIKIKFYGKKIFVFISNNININEFENFNNINIWINTACPGLANDSNRIINSEGVSLILKQN